jgi:hypothetical protein
MAGTARSGTVGPGRALRGSDTTVGRAAVGLLHQLLQIQAHAFSSSLMLSQGGHLEVTHGYLVDSAVSVGCLRANSRLTFVRINGIASTT